MAKRRRFTASDLGLTPDVVDMVQRDTKPEKRAKQGGPSKNEARYQEHLDQLVAAGVLDGYTPQPPAIALAHGVTYTADFLCFPRDGASFYVEVKGEKARRNRRTGARTSRPYFADDGARVKVRVAARLLAEKGIRLFVVWPCGREWKREEVPT